MNQTNNNNQSFAHTLSELNWPLYARAIVAPVGVLTNFINIVVFMSPKLRDTCYRYMLTNSITNLIYLTLSFTAIFYVYCLNCKPPQTYSSAIYTIWFIHFFSSSLAIFRIEVEVILSFQTFCILTKRTWLNKIPYKLILIVLFAFALAIYSQQPFAFSIVRSIYEDGTIVYTPIESEFGNSDIGKSIAIIQTTIRLFLAVIVLTVVNVLNVIEFRQRFKNRRQVRLLNVHMQSFNSHKTKNSSISICSFY